MAGPLSTTCMRLSATTTTMPTTKASPSRIVGIGLRYSMARLDPVLAEPPELDMLHLLAHIGPAAASDVGQSALPAPAVTARKRIRRAATRSSWGLRRSLRRRATLSWRSGVSWDDGSAP